jgi:tetratricopeptide (TPR) repeat protein
MNANEHRRTAMRTKPRIVLIEGIGRRSFGMLPLLLAGLSYVLLLSCSTVPYDTASQGDDLAAAGQYGQAIADYTRAINLNPKDPTAYLQRGLAYEKIRQYQKALEDYSKAIQLQPDDPELYMIRGMLFDIMNRPDSAVVDYSSAIRNNAAFAKAYYYRGLDLERAGQTEAALADFKSAATYGSTDAMTKLKNMGLTW